MRVSRTSPSPGLRSKGGSCCGSRPAATAPSSSLNAQSAATVRFAAGGGRELIILFPPPCYLEIELGAAPSRRASVALAGAFRRGRPSHTIAIGRPTPNDRLAPVGIGAIRDRFSTMSKSAYTLSEIRELIETFDWPIIVTRLGRAAAVNEGWLRQSGF